VHIDLTPRRCHPRGLSRTGCSQRGLRRQNLITAPVRHAQNESAIVEYNLQPKTTAPFEDGRTRRPGRINAVNRRRWSTSRNTLQPCATANPPTDSIVQSTQTFRDMVLEGPVDPRRWNISAASKQKVHRRPRNPGFPDALMIGLHRRPNRIVRQAPVHRRGL